MRDVRLSELRRSILSKAALGRVCIATGQPTSNARITCIKASKDLAKIGLGFIYHAPGVDGVGARRRNLVHFELTALGRRVVEAYAREFETGARIRWKRLDVTRTVFA
jgi:hypothetical protein